MTNFMRSRFVMAVQNTLDYDSLMFTACRLATSLPLTVRQWLEANTIDLSPNPQDWEPEFRLVYAMMLLDREE